MIDTQQTQNQPQPSVGDDLRSAFAEDTATDAAESAQPQADEEIYDPHPSWKPEEQEMFRKFPREAQKFVIDRYKGFQGDYTKKAQAVAAERKRYETIERVLGPRRQDLMMQYGDEGAALGQLFALSDYAAKDPAGFVRWFAQNRGIDLASLTQAEAAYQDPALTPIVNQQRQLMAAVQQQQQFLQHQQRQAVDMARRDVMSEIEAFRGQKGPDGKPAHPHFDEVQADMVAFINQGMTLKDAYDRAAWANPATRQRLSREEQARQATAERNKSARAAAAGGSIGPGASTARPNGSAGSIRAELEAAFAQHAGRV